MCLGSSGLPELAKAADFEASEAAGAGGAELARTCHNLSHNLSHNLLEKRGYGPQLVVLKKENSRSQIFL